MNSVIKTASVAVVTASLTGCIAGMPEIPGLSNLEQSTNNIMQASATGCAGGAAVGQLTGKNKTAWTAAGCMIGFFAGKYVVRQQQYYSNAADAIAKETASVESMIRQLNADNAQLRQNIAQVNTQIYQLKQKQARGAQVYQQLQQQKAGLEQQYQELQKMMAAVDNEIRVTSTTYNTHYAEASRTNPAGLQQWHSDIQQLQQQKVVLQQMLNDVYSTKNSI